MQRFLRYIFASIAIVKDYFSIIGELRRHAPGGKRVARRPVFRFFDSPVNPG